MTWANTSWGEVLVAVHALVPTYKGPGKPLPYFDAVEFGIGVDDYAKHNKESSSLSFVGPGRLAGDETFAPTTRGTAPSGMRAVIDRLVPVKCRVYVPFGET